MDATCYLCGLNYTLGITPNEQVDEVDLAKESIKTVDILLINDWDVGIT